MSVQDCYGKVLDFVKSSGAKVTKQDIKDYADIINKLQFESMSKAEFGAKVQELVSNTLDVLASKKKSEEYINLNAREIAKETILSRGKEHWFEGMRDWLEGGGLKPFQGSNYDVVKVKNAAKGQLMRLWRRSTDFESYRALISQKLDKSVISKNVYQEIDSIERGDFSNPSGSKEALAIAKGINAIQNKIFELKKAFNPWMEKIDDYRIKQIHNREKIQAVEKDVWVNDALATYGKNSFPELANKRKAFEDIYDRIKSGEYGTLKEDVDWQSSGNGPDIHRNMMRERSLIAENWEKQFEYASKYGHDTIEQTIQHTIANASRDIAMLDKFGPKYKEMYNGVKQEIKNEVGTAAFELKETFLNKRFNAATQNDLNFAKENYAKFAQGGLTISYLARMGAPVFRSFPDVMHSAALLRGVNGNNVFKNALEVVSEVSKLFVNTKARNEALDYLSLFSPTAQAHMLHDMGSVIDQPGALGKMASTLGKLNMMDRWVDSMRAGFGTVLARTMAKIAAKSHNDLPVYLKENLSRYNIGQLEWDLMRRGVQDWKELGMPAGKYQFLSAEGIEQLPDAMVESYLRSKGKISGKKVPKELLDQTRFNLGTRMTVLINDHVDLGSSTAGTRQKAFLLQGTSINDPVGVSLRLISQFKSASLVSADNYRRVFRSGGGSKGDYAGVIQMAIGSMFLWSLGQYARDAILGKTPEDPFSRSYLEKAIIGSGAAGIMGDLYISESEYGSRGEGFLSALAGPLLTDVGKGIALGIDYKQALTEDKDLPTAKTYDLLRKNLPFQNLWITKGVVDYYLLNETREFLGPGYIDNLTKRTEARGQRQFLFNPESDNILGSDL